ncbi:hypothetical protein ASPZODRAFT_20494 [Penicilliopsis zonata CBS 506.65]|uniref:Uncharacterized protein n=1 Tax=Penicilliopsis zonata CBS 506.65 TaxID=1073090 RepID=A0A1L9S5D4_9EURO|nr:hypothetical protein ASPZODRAFT_20494 [Penicilliopsis zonata CBS 506.65]OJJ42376.1 hypothetical protein ASPZODRAFT_20494 [Penicilliopsis zonata CBS 506.65]
MTTPDASLLVPIKLDIFAIGDPAAYASHCPSVTLLPTNPFDYSRLRLEPKTLHADLQEHADFASARPAAANPRLVDVATGRPRDNVSGVYLSWTLPQIYRRETIALPGAPRAPGAPGVVAPAAPNRWMVARVTRSPATNAGWVIESDVCRHIDTVDASVDLLTEAALCMAPTTGGAPSTVSLEGQGEYFLGAQRPLENWVEEAAETVRIKPLTANGAGNVLFADYQPHNPNVFSFRDPLDGVPPGTQIGYSVVGWHADAAEDPFMRQDGQEQVTNEDLLAQFGLRLDDSPGAAPWTASTLPARHLCHGSTYTLLTWSPESGASPPPDDPKISAQAAATRLQAKGSVAVGADPMDAFGAFLHSAGRGQTHLDFRTLQALAASGRPDAAVDEQTAAEQRLAILREFKVLDGGSRWKVQPAEEKNTSQDSALTMRLDSRQKTALHQLHEAQWAYNHLQFNLDHRRWKLFCEWWRCINAEQDAASEASSGMRHTQLVAEIATLLAALESLQDELAGLQSALPEVVKVPDEAFVRRKDPTLALLGCRSPWPRGFSDAQPVRLLRQCVSVFQPDRFGVEAFGEAVDMADRIVALPAAARAVHGEHCGYMSVRCGDPLPPLAPGQVEPPYRDAVYNTAAIVDSPLVPLYIEWEAEYSHIPYSLWEPRQVPGTRGAAQAYCELVQGVTATTALSAHSLERRALGGRAIIHPGPGHSLANALRQSMARMPAQVLNEELPAGERESLIASLENDIPALTCRLDGLSDQLTTLISGTTHVRPTLPDGTVLDDAVRAARGAGFTRETLRLVKNQCDPVPYGDAVDPDAVFVPVTHGQVKFTKLNVIDKFGRGVEIMRGPDGLAPSLSAGYMPSPRTDSDSGREVPNIVAPRDDDNCEYFQLPPSINQPARLVSAYLQPGADGDSPWVRCSEWEDPVCGYIMYNSADLSLQVFTAAGALYAEVLTFPGGDNAPRRRARCSVPPGRQEDDAFSGGWKTALLDRYIKALQTPQYALRMVEILGDAASCSAPPPASYSAVMNAGFGRPFALAVAGWSIELSHEPLQPQTTACQSQTGPALCDYEFPLQLGLKQHSEDGLAAYFPMLDDDSLQPDFGEIHTFWPGEAVDSTETNTFTCTPIHAASLPTLQAHHVDPFEGTQLRTVRSMARERDEQLRPFGLLVDVFHPLTAQTGVLPPATLPLPAAMVHQALKSMRVSFRSGPFLCRDDPLQSVPDPAAQDIQPPGIDAIPVLPYGKWSWLQPYIADGQTLYSSCKINKSAQSGSLNIDVNYPYTMVDGILQSDEPLLQT